MVVLIFTVGIFILFLLAISLRSMKGKENTFSLMKEEKEIAYGTKVNNAQEEDPNVQEMFDILNKKK